MNSQLLSAITPNILPAKRILFFDTETSGLIPNSASNIKEYPYILQLCFIVYDCGADMVIQTYNKYICVAEDILITPFITELTGITRDKCICDGVSIVYALQAFYEAYKKCDVVVAHNFEFDKRMMEIEIARHISQDEGGQLVEKLSSGGNNTLGVEYKNIFYNHIEDLSQMRRHFICTMQMGKSICRIMIPTKKDPTKSYMKNPKLEELYKCLFNKPIENAHDALYDTYACMQCYLKIMYNKDI